MRLGADSMVWAVGEEEGGCGCGVGGAREAGGVRILSKHESVKPLYLIGLIHIVTRPIPIERERVEGIWSGGSPTRYASGQDTSPRILSGAVRPIRLTTKSLRQSAHPMGELSTSVSHIP